MKMLKIISVLFASLLLMNGPVCAESAYISLEQLNLAKLLAPPPAAQSEQQKADMEEVLRVQQHRTSAQAERAVADNNMSIFRIAGEVLGPKFTKENLPKTTSFFDRVAGDTRTLFLAAKGVWKRPRPDEVSSEVKAVGDEPESGSYPSGHATRGYLAAILLANMVPEKSADLFARGREYTQNRVLAGAHFPSDVEAGRLAATAIATALLDNKTFVEDFNTARAELRRELGLELR